MVHCASCVNLSLSTLKKVKVLLHNFVWSGKTNNQSRAKVAWDTTILPLVKGGIKIKNPKTQTTTLLAKVLVKGLNPRLEPWKILLRHKINNLRQSFREIGTLQWDGS